MMSNVTVRYGNEVVQISKHYSPRQMAEGWFHLYGCKIRVYLHYDTGTTVLLREDDHRRPLSRHNMMVVEIQLKFEEEEVKPMSKKFYMVQAVPGELAKKVHETVTEATEEAVRLAGLVGNSNKQFYVMEAISVHKVSTPPVISESLL